MIKILAADLKITFCLNRYSFHDWKKAKKSKYLQIFSQN
jgi:hypothetical protein